MAELIAASKEGNEVEAKRLLDNGADVNARDEWQHTPLHEAENAAIAKLLLDHGADVNARSRHQSTPLHFPQNEAIAKVLLDHGADVNARGVVQQTPLHYAARNEAVVKLLVDHGADVNARDSFQETPLHRVLGSSDTMSMRETLAIVKLLVDHGADVNVRDEDQCTPLHLGLSILRLRTPPFQQACNIAMARLLVNGGAQLTAFDKWGENVLHRAAARSELELCLFYVSRGLDPNIAVEGSDATALTMYGDGDQDDDDMWPAEKKIYADQLLAAREVYEQRVRDEHWKKNWPLLNTLTGSGLRPMNEEVAALAAQQEASDKSIKLPGIPRKTKAQKIAFLNQVSSSSETQSTVFTIQLTNTPLHSNQLSTAGCVWARERALVSAPHRRVHPAHALRGGRGRGRGREWRS